MSFGVRDAIYRLPEGGLPGPETPQWDRLTRELKINFDVRSRRLNPDMGRVHVIHPSWEVLGEQVRAIFNGDADDDGNVPPRVWHYEFQLERFWLIELPVGTRMERVLLDTGDRQVAG